MTTINLIPLVILLLLLLLLKVMEIVESDSSSLYHGTTNMKERKHQIRRHTISLNTIFPQSHENKNDDIQLLFTDVPVTTTLPVVSNRRELMEQNSIITSMTNSNNHHAGISCIQNSIFPPSRISIVPVVTPIRIISSIPLLNNTTRRMTNHKNDTNSDTNHASNHHSHNNTIDTNSTTNSTPTTTIGSSSNQYDSNSNVQNNVHPIHIHIITGYIIGAVIGSILIVGLILLVSTQRKRRFHRTIYHSHSSNHHHHHPYQLSDEHSISTTSTQNMTIDD